MRWVFLGNHLTIQICLYAVFIDSTCISCTNVLHDLGISLPHQDGFSKAKSSYIKSACYSICDDYGVNAEETWMNGDCFYMTKYRVFDEGGKVTKRSPPDG